MGDYYECADCGLQVRLFGRQRRPSGGLCPACVRHRERFEEDSEAHDAHWKDKRDELARGNREELRQRAEARRAGRKWRRGGREEEEDPDLERPLLSDDARKPAFLYALAAVPWVVPVCTLGGILPVVTAVALSGVGAYLAGVRAPVLVRLAALLAWNAVGVGVALFLFLGALGRGRLR